MCAGIAYINQISRDPGDLYESETRADKMWMVTIGILMSVSGNRLILSGHVGH